MLELKVFEWTVNWSLYGLKNGQINLKFNWDKVKIYPADCRKIAAIDSHNHYWDWKRKKMETKCRKTILKCELFWVFKVLEMVTKTYENQVRVTGI